MEYIRTGETRKAVEGFVGGALGRHVCKVSRITSLDMLQGANRV